MACARPMPTLPQPHRAVRTRRQMRPLRQSLACRRGAGIEVTLLWHRTSGELTVSVTDAASGASFELPVAADEALAAFHHPYAYAAAQGVAY
jgi:hypothetical protein